MDNLLGVASICRRAALDKPSAFAMQTENGVSARVVQTAIEPRISGHERYPNRRAHVDPVVADRATGADLVQLLERVQGCPPIRHRLLRQMGVERITIGPSGSPVALARNS